MTTLDHSLPGADHLLFQILSPKIHRALSTCLLAELGRHLAELMVGETAANDGRTGTPQINAVLADAFYRISVAPPRDDAHEQEMLFMLAF